MSQRVWPAVFAAAVLAGVVLRALPLFGDFPWYDGGLFADIIDQLRAGSLLPAEFAWSGHQIPFAYPPLAFDAAALMGRVTGASTLDLLRWLPVLGSIAALGALYVAIDRLFDRRLAMGAVASCAIMPEGFFQLIAGGGLTRSFGLALALLSLAAVGQARRTLDLRWSLLAGVALGLTALTHPMTALLAGWGIVFLLGVGVPWRRRAALAGLALLAAFVVVLPWLGMIAAREQLDALLGAGQRSNPLDQLLSFGQLLLDTSSPLLRLGAIGLGLALLERRWAIGGLALATIIGPGWFFVVTPLAVGAGYLAIRAGELVQMRSPLLARALPVLAVSVVVLSFTTSLQGLRASDSIADTAPYRAAAASPPNTSFLVAPTAVWGNDLSSEWFPYLAERPSLFTVQGSEWLGRDIFFELREEHAEARTCAADGDVDCLERLAADTGAAGAWLFVPADPQLEQLIANLRADPAWDERFADEGASVFAPAS